MALFLTQVGDVCVQVVITFNVNGVVTALILRRSKML